MSRPFASPQFLRKFGESAVLIRQAPGHHNEFGEWAPGAEERFPLSVVSAPPSMATLREILPEGARLQDARQFWFEEYNAEPLRVGTEATEGDVIEYVGIRYRVRHAQDWHPHGFLDVLAVREEGQDGD